MKENNDYVVVYAVNGFVDYFFANIPKGYDMAKIWDVAQERVPKSVINTQLKYMALYKMKEIYEERPTSSYQTLQQELETSVSLLEKPSGPLRKTVNLLKYFFSRLFS